PYPFKKEVEVVVEFQIHPYFVKDHDDPEVISKIQKEIKDAIRLRGQLEFVRFEGIPDSNFVNTRNFLFKPSYPMSNPPWVQQPYSHTDSTSPYNAFSERSFPSPSSGLSAPTSFSIPNTIADNKPIFSSVRSPITVCGDAHNELIQRL